MTDYLLDTNILIRYLRKTEGFDNLLAALADNDWLCISAMTRFEVVRGMKDRERDTTYNLLNSLESLAISTEIADSAGELVRSCRMQGITLDEADAVIAATAMQHNLALVTTNAKHFSMHKMIVFEADDKGKLTLCE
jgi:predicted nucleic acid-binding protein